MTSRSLGTGNDPHRLPPAPAVRREPPARAAALRAAIERPPPRQPRLQPRPPAPTIPAAWRGARTVAATVDAAGVMLVSWFGARAGASFFDSLVESYTDLGILFAWVPGAFVATGIVVWVSVWLPIELYTGRSLGSLLTGTRVVSAETGLRPLASMFGYRCAQLAAALVGFVLGAALTPPAPFARDVAHVMGWPAAGAALGAILLTALPFRRGGTGVGWAEWCTGVRTCPARPAPRS